MKRGRARRAAALMAGGLLAACAAPGRAPVGPAVEITVFPEASEGGPDRMEPIEGRVTGGRPDQKVVLYARSGAWWVQPFIEEPYTPILADGTWRARTHLGTEYAALLVAPSYKPQALVEDLPAPGGGVVAVGRVAGAPATAPAARKTLPFAGYDWAVRSVPSDRGVWMNRYDPANAWTDAQGALHLRIAPDAEGFTSAEVTLGRSLGYGTYSVTVRDVGHLPPAVVLGFFTWDEASPEQRFREMDVEISRFGDPTNLNAQYVVQPYYVAANVRRFAAPAGVLTHTLRWEAGRASFRTVRGRRGGPEPEVAEHVFTSGVPVPGKENVRLNLYVFGRPVGLPREATEVVIEAFEYLP